MRDEETGFGRHMKFQRRRKCSSKREREEGI